MKKIIILIVGIILLAACSTPKAQRDDAVRIKKGSEKKYNIHPEIPITRNGSTLRGEVLKIQVEIKPDSCPINPYTKWTSKSYLLFIDSNLKSSRTIERIPLEDIDLIGTKLNIPKNNFANINYFETYNNPLLPLEIREVPVDTIKADCDATPCPCEPISFSLEMPCLLCLDCPKREPSDLFLSIKPGLAFYDDVDKNGNLMGRDDYLLDLAVGYRWGETKRWAAGLIFSSGVQTMSKIDSTLIRRPSANLYARYDLIRNTKRIEKKSFISDTIDKTWITYDTIRTKTQECCNDSIVIIPRITPDFLVKMEEMKKVEEYEERPCLNPFVYGLFGASIDDFSIDLFKLNWNDDCKDKIGVEPPGISFDMPLNFGFGVGIEYPLSKHIDLSADLGFRSISYGDKFIISGLLVPNNQRVNSIVFRIGIVY